MLGQNIKNNARYDPRYKKIIAVFFISCQIRSLEGAPLPANAARGSRWRDVAGLRGDAGGHEAATLPEDEEGRRGPSKQTRSICDCERDECSFYSCVGARLEGGNQLVLEGGPLH